MFHADVLTLQEFAVQEQLPLTTIQRAVLEFLRGRDDIVVFGAQAVNAYVNEPRMTQAIDLIATKAEAVAEEIRAHLVAQFHIAVRIREVANGRGYRVFQVRKAGNRHLVDLRSAESVPAARRIADILVMAPDELIASKVISYYQRRGKPKSGTDWRDLALLLLTFPELKSESSTVTSCLLAASAGAPIMDLWHHLVETPIEIEEDEDEFF